MQRAFSLDWSPNALSPCSQKNILQKYNKKIENLEKELQDETTEKEELYQLKSQLENKLTAIEKQLNLKNRENERLKDDLNTLQTNLEEYASNQTAKETIKKLNTIVKDLRAENEAGKKYSSKLENESESYQKRVQDHKKELEKLFNNCVNIETENEKLKKDLSCRNDELNRLHNQAQHLENQLRDQKELNRELIEENLKLESKMLPRFEQVESLGRELEFQSMKERIDDMTNEMEQVAQQVDVLKREKEELNRNVEESQRTIESCNREKEILVTRLTGEKTEIERKLNDLSEEHRSLSSQFADKCALNTTLEVRLRDMGDQFQKLQLESDAMKNDYEELVQNCEKYATLLRESESQLKLTDSAKIKLEKNLKELNEKLELLGNKCVTLEKSLLDSSNNMQLLANEKSRLHCDLEQLKCNYETISMENRSLNERLRRMDVEYAAQSEKLNETRISLNSRDAQLEVVSKQHQILIEEHRELQENNEIYAKLLTTTNEKLRQCENDLKDHMLRLDAATQQCQRLSVANASYEAQISGLKRELETERVDRQNVAEKLAESERRANALTEKTALLAKREHELVDRLDQSKTACGKLSTENQSLVSQLEVERGKHDCMSELCVQLERQLHNTRTEYELLLAVESDRVAEIEADKKQLVQNYESLRGTCEELTAELQNISRMNGELSQLLKQTRDEKSIIEHRVESLEADKLRLIETDKAERKKYEAAERRLVELEADLDALRKNLAERDTALREMNGHREQLQFVYDDCKAQLMDAKALLEKIEAKKTEAETKLSTTEDALSSCRADLQAAEREMADLKTSFERTTLENENTKRILMSSTDELKMWMENADKLKAELESVKEENESLQTVRDSLNKLKDELAKKDDEATELQNTLDTLRNDKITLEELLQNGRDEFGRVETKAKQYEECLQQTKAKLSAVSAVNDQLKEEKERKESCLKELTEKLQIQTTLGEQLADEKSQTENILRELKNDFERLSDGKRKMKEVLEELEQKNKSLEESISLSEAELRQQRDASEEIRITLEAERSEKLAAKNTLQERANELQKMRENETQLAEKCQRLERAIETLSREKATVEERLRENVRQSEQLATRMETTKRACDELQSTRDNQERVLTEVRDENGSLRSENVRLREKCEQVEKECGIVKASIDEYASSIDSLRKDNAARVDAFNEVESKLAASTKELDESREQIDRLRADHEKTIRQMAENDRKVVTENRCLAEQLERVRNELKDVLRTCEDANASKRNLETRLRELAAVEEEKSTLQRRNRELEGQIKSSEELRETLLYEIERSQRCVEEMKRENAELGEKNSEKLTSLKKVEKRFDELSAEMATLREAYQKGEKKLAELTQSDANLRQEIEETRMDKEELRKLMNIESKQARTFLNELEEMKIRVVELSKEKEEFYKMETINAEAFEALKNKLTNEQAKLEELSDCLESMKKQKEELESDEKRLQAQVKSLSAAFDEQKSRNVSIEEELRKRTETSSDENSLKARLEAENEKLHGKISDMRKQLEKEKEVYAEKGKKLYERVTNKLMAEFEGKLERAKTEYQKILSQKYASQMSEWNKKEEEYKKMLKKEKEHIRELSSQMWDVSDKYLQLKQKFDVKGTPTRFRAFSVENISSPSTLTRKTRSVSQLNLAGGKSYGVLDFNRRLSAMSEDLPPPSSSFTRRRQTLTTSAKVFPTEDEEQEIFDNACLADLKQGRMPSLDSSDFSKDRLSVLQARNSLCPPHLKSSYPAETQFIPLHDFRENDIKMGKGQPNESDEENLLPRDSMKKSRNQTSYKKPGPPTPSKNGGRSSQSECNGGTPRNVLKELNDNGGTGGGARRKSCTPKFFNIFSLRGHATVTMPSSQNDENSRGTPTYNRLSSIRRRLTKNTREQGNSNNAYR